MRHSLQATLLALIVLCSCHSPEPAGTAEPDLLAANIDSTVSPSTDFFQYANGGWIKRTAIPASESQWGVGNLILDENYARLKQISMEAGTKGAPKGSADQQIGDFWFSGMDSVETEKQKLEPLRPWLNEIAAVKNVPGLVNELAGLQEMAINAGFSNNVGVDDKRSDVMAIFLYQGGLGMGNRDYYFRTDSTTTRVRTAYRSFMNECFRQLGLDSSRAISAAGRVYDLETRLAKVSRTLTQLRDPYRNYNKMTVAALQALCPAIGWPDYFRRCAMGRPDSVIVCQPEFFQALGKELTASGLEDWKNYLSFHLLKENSGFLDSTIRNAAFAYGKTLTGATEQRPRWKEVLDAEEEILGPALGELFVRETFSAQEKARYVQMVENVRAAYRERIRALSWMSEATKQRAYDKLARINMKVGYPDKWKDLHSMVIDRGPWVLNFRRGCAWLHADNAGKLGKPVDHTEWDMTPQTYNAYYDGTKNEAVFPAAQFFVPGKKTSQLDDAFNYGYAAASTIGHELTHGFDDQGRQYDASGNLKGWWQPADSVAFTERAAKIVRQFDEFIAVDTMHVNGAATEGENIADLGGLLIGLDAFKKTPAWQKKEKIGGFSPLQRFFLGYSYGWLVNEKKEKVARQVMTDYHAPAKERLNGPLANIPEFYEAFDIKPGTPMYRPDSLRVNIW